jgi:homoserine kinase type II
LFAGDRVTGFIDFGAVNVESVSGDIARLLGDAACDDTSLWTAGLEAYRSVRELSPAERELIPVFDASGKLLSGMQWLTWIYIERRTFADRPAVIARLDQLIDRLTRVA